VKKKKSKLQQKKDNPRSKYWKTRADKLWGEAIHLIYKACAVCGKEPTESHHLIGRANTATRHEIENGIGLCALHHKWDNKLSAHSAPLAFAEWLQENDPDKWEWASKNKNRIEKPDYESAYYRLEEELKKMRQEGF